MSTLGFHFRNKAQSPVLYIDQAECCDGEILCHMKKKMKVKTAYVQLVGVASSTVKKRSGKTADGQVVPVSNEVVFFDKMFTLAHDDPISVHVHHPNSTKQRLLKRRGIVIPKEKLFAEEDSFDVSYEIRLQINRGFMHKNIRKTIPVEVGICEHNVNWLANYAMAGDAKMQERIETVAGAVNRMRVTLGTNVVRAGGILPLHVTINNPGKKSIKVIKIKFQRHSTLSATVGQQVIPLQAATNASQFKFEAPNSSVPANTITPLELDIEVPVPRNLPLSYPVGFDYSAIFGAKTVTSVMFHVLVLPQAGTAVLSRQVYNAPVPMAQGIWQGQQYMQTEVYQPSYSQQQPVSAVAQQQPIAQPLALQQPQYTPSAPPVSIYPSAYPISDPPAYEPPPYESPMHMMESKPVVLDPLPQESGAESSYALDPLAVEEVRRASPVRVSPIAAASSSTAAPKRLSASIASPSIASPSAPPRSSPTPTTSRVSPLSVETRHSVVSAPEVDTPVFGNAEQSPPAPILVAPDNQEEPSVSEAISQEAVEFTPMMYFPPIPTDQVVMDDESDHEHEQEAEADDGDGDVQERDEEEVITDDEEESQEEEPVRARAMVMA